MKWVTRENAKVDRIACPWLIRHFVDKDAEFLFVPKDQVMKIAEQQGAIPFDVPNVESGHADGRCSFESIILKYDLTKDAALSRLARIVHAADIPEHLGSSLEGPGLRAFAEGFAILHGVNDRKKMELEFPLYDALYAWCGINE